MKLQNLSVIFVIIAIPIILITSYYISLQSDTINIQTSYNTKLLESTKEAIEAFEINTLEWNESYSETADSKRRDVNASINTFITAFSNNLGVSGATKEDITSYIPAIVFTLYDGYYIYSPTETKIVSRDNKGVVKTNEAGEILYITPTGEETTNPDEAATEYKHILKPFTSYSKRYKKDDDNDIVISYTLDNYITVVGTVNGEYVNKSGYYGKYSGRNNHWKIMDLVGDLNTDSFETGGEQLSEQIFYKGLNEPETFQYIYECENNTKVYFDNNDGTPFQVSSNNIRTDLKDTASVKYNKIVILRSIGQLNKYGRYSKIIYQALNDSNDGSIKAGQYYQEMNNAETIITDPQVIRINDYIKLEAGRIIHLDFSYALYLKEAIDFSDWIQTNLIWIKYDKYSSLYFGGSDLSKFENHKREIIKEKLESDLNQAISSYSRNSDGEYYLPKLSEEDWDQILTNVSITTFVQGIPIGMKYYNNYAIATSTINKEYVNPEEIYIYSEDEPQIYHRLYCSEIQNRENLVAYRGTDYILKSYIDEAGKTKYYYTHDNNINKKYQQACYYCIVQRDLLQIQEEDKVKNAYYKALFRERCISQKSRK